MFSHPISMRNNRSRRLSYKSMASDQPADSGSGSVSTDEQQQPAEESEKDQPAPMRNSGECRLMRAINEVLGYNSRQCSTGCLYSMEEVIPSCYLLLIDEQNNSWFSMQLLASYQPVQLWFADFSARLQESLDEESRGRLFLPANCHVFVGAKGQTAGAPLHCRRFAYLPAEVLHHPSLMLHHLPISPDQLLLVDHVCQAAAYVPITVGFSKQSEKLASLVSIDTD